MGKIKTLSMLTDKEKGVLIKEGSIIDLGKVRNELVVKNNLAIWVDSTDFEENETEKKEETPKKIISNPKGKKIETK